ncbi:ATP-dependent DNA helicase II subunit 2 [Asimina triloba]
MARNKVHPALQTRAIFDSSECCTDRIVLNRLILEALVLLLDVGPSMHDLLPEIEKVERQTIKGLHDLLLLGQLRWKTRSVLDVYKLGNINNVPSHVQKNCKTDNDLTKEVGGYEHVAVLQQIKVVDSDTVDALQKLPRGSACGDCIQDLMSLDCFAGVYFFPGFVINSLTTLLVMDAIVVGMDLLIKKFGTSSKGKQRLCLITSAKDPIKEPYEGTKEDQIDTISAQMKSHGMRLDCIVARGKLKGTADHKIMDENDHLLNRFSKKTISKTVHVDSPISLRGALRTRNISPVTIYRGDLELCPSMKIKVWVYKKTSEEKFPTLKKYSDKAPSNDRFATHEVKIDIEYRSFEDSNKVIPPEQRIKGYRYGPQVVPISSAEWEAVKFRPEKSVKLLGFTDASNIMRHYYMKDANVFIPEPGNTKAILAVSSLARAMKEMNKVAILRCVWRQGQGSVVIGVLTPNLSTMHNIVSSIPDSFYFNVLPFAEDVREFQFPSFSNFPSSWLPNNQQQEAADNLVQMLDLAPAGTEEVLQPDFTPNPVLEYVFFQRFYNFLELKSKHPDADVPPLDPTLKQIMEPDPYLLSQNQSVVANFRKQFELKGNPKVEVNSTAPIFIWFAVFSKSIVLQKKKSRLLWKDKPSASDEKRGAEDDESDVQSVKLIENSSKIKVEEIGDLTPVQDFDAMMACRDSCEWVSKAIKGMKARISALLDTLSEGSNYDTAIECLLALRRGCVLEQEPKEFNQFMHDLSKKCEEKGFKRFWELIIAKHITFISKDEAKDSDISDDEAKKFLVKTEVKSK